MRDVSSVITATTVVSSTLAASRATLNYFLQQKLNVYSLLFAKEIEFGSNHSSTHFRPISSASRSSSRIEKLKPESLIKYIIHLLNENLYLQL